MHLTAEFTSIYEDGDQHVTSQNIDVEAPDDLDDLDTWSEEQLWPYTGTDRKEGNAGYFVTVTACPEAPDLVGHEFEWV